MHRYFEPQKILISLNYKNKAYIILFQLFLNFDSPKIIRQFPYSSNIQNISISTFKNVYHFNNPNFFKTNYFHLFFNRYL